MRKLLVVYFKGIAMGAADIVPGVSGGTIALITGIYQELIQTINTLNISVIRDLKKKSFSETWKHINGSFLIALLLGITTSIFSFAKLFGWLLIHHPILLWSFFFGLVTSSLMYIIKKISYWSFTQVIALLLSFTLSLWITLAQVSSSVDNNWYLFLSGFLAIIAMVLPGISGAFILVLLGSYEPILRLVESLSSSIYMGNTSLFFQSLVKLMFVVTGALIGIKLFSKILKWMFENHRNMTFSILVGFMLGSLHKLWPWQEAFQSKLIRGKIVITDQRLVLPRDFKGDAQLWVAILFALSGFILVLVLDIIANKEHAQQKT